MSDRPTSRMHVISAADDWEEKTVAEPGPRVTLADLHTIMGKLAKAVTWLAVMVGSLTLVTILHLWVIW